MNTLTIIGNLTRAPETRTTQTGKNVCTFTVAVNRRKASGGNQPETDFFRVTVWDKMAQICQTYLDKGRKVCVTGPVSVSTWQAGDGATRFQLEVTAQDVEFLSPRSDAETVAAAPDVPASAAGYGEVETEDLPY